MRGMQFAVLEWVTRFGPTTDGRCEAADGADEDGCGDAACPGFGGDHGGTALRVAEAPGTFRLALPAFVEVRTC